MKHNVEVKEFPDAEMVEIWVDGDPAYIGNRWDYHHGCHGYGIMTVQRKKIDLGKNWRGWYHVATRIASAFDTHYKYRRYRMQWWDWQKRYGYHKEA